VGDIVALWGEYLMKQIVAPIALLALAVGVASCKTHNPSAPVQTSVAPAPTLITGQAVSVDRCFTQMADGLSVQDRFTPDTLTIDLARPASFPNGRRPQDQVIDITLSMILLDQTRQTLRTLANLPLNPGGIDVPLRTDFPFLAPAQGNPPQFPTGGVNFNFRTDAPSAYTRVDRMGMPAVATALISSSAKLQFNDANPSDDMAGRFTAETNSTLKTLATALVDDLQGLGLVPCATQ
jgi:hypothetical protein